MTRVGRGSRRRSWALARDRLQRFYEGGSQDRRRIDPWSSRTSPADSRPREKLLASGAAALADAELVALLLRTGLKGISVLQLAQQLLDQFGGVAGLLHAQADDLKQIKGLGPAKRAEVAAVIELARRALSQQPAQQPLFDTPARVKDYLQLQLGSRPIEVFAMLFLDAQNRLLRLEEMFRGSLRQTSVYPREVVRRALELHAGAVILAH
jgi:DNA repair protein RadC